MKKKVLFVCLGNICRSPAAEGVFRELVKKQNLEHNYFIDSAGTNGFHNGELPDKRMRKHGSYRGYDFNTISRQVKQNDFNEFDIIVAMDDSNVKNLKNIAPGNTDSKIRKLTDFSQRLHHKHVPDPYFGGPDGFEQVLDIVEDACEGLLNHLQNETTPH